MSYKDVRRGHTQAEFNDTASNWLFFEVLFLAVAAGLTTSSWWVFGGCILGMLIMTWVRKLAIVLVIILTLLWTVIAFAVGLNFWGWGAALVLGVLALLITAGLHMGALEWMDDVSYKEDDD